MRKLIAEAQRLLEARPIPLPKAAVDAAMKQIVRHLKGAFESHEEDSPGEPLGTGVWAITNIAVKDVLGKKKSIGITVHSVPSPSNLLVPSAAYDPQKHDIDIYIQGRFPGHLALMILQGKGKRKLEGAIRDSLEHELTHALDNLRLGQAGYHGHDVASYASTKTGQATKIKDYRRYINQRVEVNAHMQQVVSQVQVAAKKLARILTKKSLAQRVTLLLKQSDTWSDIRGHLNKRNKQRILKAVYAALSSS
jgi:hypothetical protein